MTRRRTNIVLEMDLVGAIMRRYQLRTITEAVHYALEFLHGRPMTREEVLAMEGQHNIGEVPPDEHPPEFR